MTQDTVAANGDPKSGMRHHANFLWRFILFARPFFSAEHKWRNRGWLVLTIVGGAKALQGEDWKNPVKHVIKVEALSER